MLFRLFLALESEVIIERPDVSSGTVLPWDPKFPY